MDGSGSANASSPDSRPFPRHSISPTLKRRRISGPGRTVLQIRDYSGKWLATEGWTKQGSWKILSGKRKETWDSLHRTLGESPSFYAVVLVQPLPRCLLGQLSVDVGAGYLGQNSSVLHSQAGFSSAATSLPDRIAVCVEVPSLSSILSASVNEWVVQSSNETVFNRQDDMFVSLCLLATRTQHLSDLLRRELSETHEPTKPLYSELPMRGGVAVVAL